MMSTGPHDSERNMDFWYSNDRWKDILGADEAETICVPPSLDVLKSWKRNDCDEAAHLATHILGQKGEAAFMLKFQELSIGGILVSGLKFHELVVCLTGQKKVRKVKRGQKNQDGEWDAIFFHQNRGIFVIEVKATELNDEIVVSKRIETAKTQLDKNIEKIKHSFPLLYQKECTCIAGIICFPFRNEARKTYEGYRVIDKSTLNDHAIFKKFFEPQTNDRMTDVSLLQRFAAEFVCCRAQVEFHSQAYNAMQVATWIMEQDIAQKQDPKMLMNMLGNGSCGKIILTAQQLEVVECREKCVTIRGAPGSGKTLILMLRALKAAMENRAGSVFVFVNKELKAKYEHYFFEEREKIFVDYVKNIDRRPKIHTIDKINFVKSEDDVFFDETPVDDTYVKKVESRVNCSGSTTIVFTGFRKPGEAVASFRLYEPRLKQFKHFELMKVLRGTGNIFGMWEEYYPHGITIGHSIYGVAVKRVSFDSFEQVQNEIANKIASLTSANISNTDLPSLKKEHIAVITCDNSDSTEMRNYFETKEIPCGQVNEQARRLKSTSIIAVDVYLNTPSYEWPVVFVILKPGVTKKEVLPIAASRCIASLTIITYKKATASSIKADEPHSMEEEIIKESNQALSTSSTSSSLSSTEDWQKKLKTREKSQSTFSIQCSLRRIYSKSYRNLIPFSLPFVYDIERKWVELTLKLEDSSIVTEEYVDLLKKAFAKADMLIIEGDPGVGKSSLMHRLAYEWTQEQSRLSDYDLVLHIEFRKLREYEFKGIKELITHYMKGYLDEEIYKIFDHFINDTKCCKENKILVLLDGYDESSLDEQCRELSDFFSSIISRPLQFNILITSRKGYLSKLHNQGRFIFADIVGFTTESQRKEYISKHFKAINDTESSDNTAAVIYLLDSSANLKRLSETPLMLTFICLLHKKIIDGTEVELYMNIIWWMIDRYQKSNLNLDVPSLFDFEHDASDKFRVIENNYQHFPQLHTLGAMAMQDIFKTTFTETDLENFQLKEIVQQVGFLRKEETRDCTYHTRTEYSFVHRTIQEFLMALTFFFSNEEPTEHFCWYIFHSGRYVGYGIIQAKLQKFLNMIYTHRININRSTKNKYTQLIKKTKPLLLSDSQKLPQVCTITVHSQEDVFHLSRNTNKKFPKSQEEAIKLVQDEANEGDALAQYVLGIINDKGILSAQSDEEAVKWYRKSAEQGNANAQFNLGVMYQAGLGVPQSDEEAVKWFTKSAEQGDAEAQFNLGVMYRNGQGVHQSNEEAVKWFTKSAEQGDAEAQFNLGMMYRNRQGVTQSDEEAVKWFTKSAEQGHAGGQNYLGFMYMNGKGVPQSDEEAIKWYIKSAKQGYTLDRNSLEWMYQTAQDALRSDEGVIKMNCKAGEQEKANAKESLGWICKHMQDVSQSDEEVIKWLRRSTEKRNKGSKKNLYTNGKRTHQSDQEANEWFRKSIEKGDAHTQYILGQMYYKGKGVAQSEKDAVKWYKKSAEHENGNAEFNLGLMFMNGRGTPQSDKEAVRWFRKSAEQGNAHAQYNLALMYMNGTGVPQSDEEAVRWYRKSAEKRNVVGLNNLELMSANDKTVFQSDEEAVKLFKKAAEQANANALFNARVKYKNNKRVSQSDEEAVKRYTKSAEQGNSNVPFEVRVIQTNDNGAPQSDGETVKWFRETAEQEIATVRLNRIEIFESGSIHQLAKEENESSTGNDPVLPKPSSRIPSTKISIDTISVQKIEVLAPQLPARDDKHEQVRSRTEMHNITRLMNYVTRKSRWVKISISAVLIFTFALALTGIILFIILRSVESPNENFNETSTVIPTEGSTSSVSETLTAISTATTSLPITITSTVTYSSQTTGSNHNTEKGSTEYITTASTSTTPNVEVMAPKVISAALDDDQNIVSVDWVLTDKSCPGIIRRYKLIVSCYNDQAISSGNFYFDCRSGFLGPMLNGTAPGKCKREDIYIKLRIGTANSMSDESEPFLVKYEAWSPWVIIASVLGTLLIMVAIALVIFYCYHKRRVKSFQNAHQAVQKLLHMQRKSGVGQSFRARIAPDLPIPAAPESNNSLGGTTAYQTICATSEVGSLYSLQVPEIQNETASTTPRDSLAYRFIAY